ncbi:MAG: efflux RND transporter periplasmic adaptor subunit [Paraprevotella sp.]|nr:efflux RND transporter periplasmic adaptor subunit [Paraprevotella sp.]
MKVLIKGICGLAALCLAASCKNNDEDFDATGIFESTEVIVSSEANGKIMALNMEEGDVLKQGQFVGYVDSVQLYLKKEQLEANLRSIGSKREDVAKQVAATREQIAKAEIERNRCVNLLKQDAGTQKQVDDAESQLAVLRKQLAAQLSTLNNANQGVSDEGDATKVQIMQTDDQLEKCRITSPMEGTVLTKYAEQGEVTTQGKPLFKIADMQHIFLRAYVSSDQLSAVKLGQQVKVYADYGEEDRKEYAGKITWISNQAEFTPKTIQTRDERANLVYAVKIAVKNDGKLKLGMYGEVKFK